jgi:hypothetical protein
LAEPAFEGIAIIGLKGGQSGVQQFAARHDDHVEPWCDLVTTKDLSYQPFSSISLNGAAQLSRGRDAQTADVTTVGQNEERAEPARDARTPLINLLEFSAPSDPLILAESARLGHGVLLLYSLLTVSLLRPLARRRFKTRRPFFVPIRTRKP